MIKPSSILFFLIILIFYYIFLFDSVHSYFSQDDFFHLRAIHQKSIKDIPKFFMGVSPEYGFFRPLPRETYNLLMFKSFGLNPLPFHIVNLLIIIINSFLLFLLIKQLISNFSLSLLTSILYLTSSVHSIELYYLGSVQQLMATMFLIISSLFFVKYLREKKLNNYLVSFLSYLLALLCHELAIVQPGILLLLSFFTFKRKEQSFSGIIFKLLPFALLSLLHSLFIMNISLPKQQVYVPLLSLKGMVNNLVWYFLWSFGLPESLVDFIGPGLRVNLNFFKWFSNYSLLVFSALGLAMFLLLLTVLLQRGKVLINKSTFLFLSLFLISVVPFLFFPQHKFVYYLSFAIIWFCACLSTILSWKSKKLRISSIIIIFCYLLISYQTTRFYETTYWAAKRAAAAKVILQDLKQAYPRVETNTIFYIIDDLSYPNIAKEWGTSSRQAFYILSGSDALKLLYSDPSIETYYQATGGLPGSIDKKRVINFVAKFPY